MHIFDMKKIQHEAKVGIVSHKWSFSVLEQPPVVPLHYLGLVDGGGMWADHSGARPRFGPDRAVSLLISWHTVSLGHLGAVGLAVLVVGMLLAGRSPQTLIHLVLVVCHRWVAAAQRGALVVLGDASQLRAPICRDDGRAVQLPYVSGLYNWEGRRREGRVQTGLLLQTQDTDRALY